MNYFANKVILITGASAGIGLACAERFTALGARVITCQRRQSSAFETIEADLADTTAPALIINEVHKRAGTLDVLVNNAGMMLESTADQLEFEEWEKTLTVNLTAPFLLIKHAFESLKRGTPGSIVNIGSIEGLASNPGHAAYCASKAGLHGLTRAVAIDYGQYGIRCNAVAPGWIDTELNEDFIGSMPNAAQFREKIGAIHPVGRTGKPEEVASLVTWLASDEAAFVTGQTYTVDGGRTAQLSLP